MNATLVAILFCLVSAVAYATAAVAQSRLAGRTEPGTGGLRLLGRGAWWASVGLNATGALLHVAALKYGPLTLVQPLGALTLVAAVPLGARTAGRKVSGTEWRGTVLTLVGLAALLAAAGGAEPHETLGLGEALAVGAVTLAVVSGLGRPGARPGLRHAAASGITSGVASALTQTLTVAFTAHTAGALFTPRTVVVTLLVAAFSMGGLLFSQTAYRDGLGAPLAVLTLANPVAAATIGIVLLRERLQGGPLSLVPAVVGIALSAYGVILLCRAQSRTQAAAEAPAPAPEPVSDDPVRPLPASGPVPEPASVVPATATAPVVVPGRHPASPVPAAGHTRRRGRSLRTVIGSPRSSRSLKRAVADSPEPVTASGS
ncbi:DMT family transporter [Streptomyces sp. NBC_00102]|uniref:DMT family transporter n=1 Tax=Streptomyces sp. NBC_00102 TaxID=2975652 RepID=UPI002257CA68|nr:DMT family transporter [Streptomyces sp. NBC_00102]MCX5401246.1 DMT family transporter [Streptomyces sp. NBC_00102]